MMPIGYTTYCAGSFEDLVAQQSAMVAQEEATPEGTLALMELTLSEAPEPDVLITLNNQLLGAGVPPWTGYSNVVFTDSTDPKKVYVAWTKGFAWTPIIIGIVFLVLPLILGAVLWFLIPQPVKDMMTLMGVMAIMIPLVGMVTKEK
jgi:hypothetical protein